MAHRPPRPPAVRRYPDLRYKFMRGLKKHEYQQRKHAFLKGAAEWTSKAIVSLSLTDQPIRSAKQAVALEGVGPTIKVRLDKIQKESEFSPEPPPAGMFISSAAGLLVGLLNATEEAAKMNEGSSVKPLVGEPELRQACQVVCQERFSTVTVSTDGSPVLCPVWWRINVLISRGFVKKRTRGKQPVYELLLQGEQIAQRLRGPFHAMPHAAGLPEYNRSVGSTSASEKTPVARKPSSDRKTPARSVQKAPQGTPEGDALYSYDDGSDGVILLVDQHEMGGDRYRLGELSRMLKDWDVRHKTTSLPCADYLWLWRCNGSDITLPVLVERKRADDVAGSLKDGRFYKQRERMLEWRDKFGVLSSDVSLKYVIESEPAAYRVRCADGCGGVGKCGNPTVEQVQVVLSELESSTDFDVVKTPNLEVTVDFLASVTAELHQRVRNGDFEAHRLLNNTHPRVQGRHEHFRTTSLGSTATSTRTEPKMPCRRLMSENESLLRSPRTSTSVSCIEIKDNPEGILSKPNDFQELSGHDTFSRNHLPSQTSAQRIANGSASSERKRYRAIDIDDVSNEDEHGKRIHLSSSTASKIYDSDSDEESLLTTSMFGGNSVDFTRTRLDSETSSNGLNDIDIYSPKSTSTLNATEESKSLEAKFSAKHTNSAANSPPSGSTRESDELKISEIQSILPGVSLEDVVSALSSASGDVERAFAFILDTGVADSKTRTKKDFMVDSRHGDHDTIDLTLSQ